MKKTWLIAKTVLIEALRRKEIYVIVLLSVSLIGLLGTVRFFNIEGLGKFYREIALKLMSVATALTVVVLAARQLPREFKNRTVLPLMAKPVSRMSFLLGKFLGVMLAAGFCYALFIAVFLIGHVYLRTPVHWALLLQSVYLQGLAFAVVASLAFLLSLVLNLDAAVTLSALLYILGQIFTSALSYIYDYVSAFGQAVLLFLNFIIPQLTLFDISSKVVHGNTWSPIEMWAMRDLTLYAGGYIVVFLGLSYVIFRRRPI